MNAQPIRKLFTVSEYDQLTDTGFFAGKKRVELIEGELIEKMTQGDQHISCINRLNMFFAPALAGKAIVSVQNAVVIDAYSAPEPDVAILRFRDDFYSTGKARPEDILLAIEVSDSTASFDRRVKMPMYARAGLAEAWLVNLPRKVLEVHREPKNGKYEIVQKLGRSETISPLGFSNLKLKIADLID